MELKERRLRKRSMYLVINQAMADIFVAASVISHCLYLGSDCEFWTIQYLSVLYSSVSFVSWIFPTASLINLAAILWRGRTQRFVLSSIAFSKRKSLEQL